MATFADCRKCGGLTVVVDSGSVYGGTVSYCIPCMMKVERGLDARIAALAAENERLRTALESIVSQCDRGDMLINEVIADIARAALAAAKRST